jgi:uncharacterized UBP type Zn finger protein
MPDEACTHVDQVPGAEPETTDGCQACLEEGRDDWVELRVCQTCGHVGCCGSSPGDHASKHHEETGHPVIEPLDGDWAWCYEDEAYA